MIFTGEEFVNLITVSLTKREVQGQKKKVGIPLNIAGHGGFYEDE